MPGHYLMRNVDKTEEKVQVENDVVVDVLVSGPEMGAAFTRAEERQLVRKLDRRIIPMLAIMNLFAGLLFSFVDAFFAETNRPFSSRQDEPGQRATAGAPTGHPERRPHRGTLRLGQ